MTTNNQIKAIVDRIEALESEKAEISDSIREVYAEAQGNGFSAKTIRKLIKLRKLSPAERKKEAELLNLYMAAVGMEGTPLGEWAEGKNREAAA